jgi:hypothetical protein
VQLSALLLPTGDGEPADALDAFVSLRLFEGGAWSSPRVSDGIDSFRVVRESPTHLEVAGRIWDIDQVLHSFWLVVQRAEAEALTVAWTLYFEPDIGGTTSRRARNAIHAIDTPDQIAWQGIFEGRVTLG